MADNPKANPDPQSNQQKDPEDWVTGEEPMSAGLKSLETTRLRVTNPGDQIVAFCLEPWARLYTLDPHSSLDVVFEADSPGVPEVFHEPDRIVVYAWPGANARVLRDGVELDDQPQG